MRRRRRTHRRKVDPNADPNGGADECLFVRISARSACFTLTLGGFEARLPLRLLTLTLTPTGNSAMNRRLTPEQLRDVISRAEALIGDTLDDLVQRYQLGATSKTPPRYQHRLIELLLRMRKAADSPDDGLAESTAALAAAEVSGILQTFEDWQSDPAWPEFQQAARDPRTYLHAVTTLTVATALRQHHPGTVLVASSSPGRSPDLRMVVTDEHDLAVEMKTSLSLGQRAKPMRLDEAIEFITDALKNASSGFRGQLEEGHPGVLVVGGFHIDPETFKALGDAAGEVLARGRRRTHLLAIVINHTRFIAPTMERDRVIVGLAHETRIRSNPRYAGDLRFVGEWFGEWRLEKTI